MRKVKSIGLRVGSVCAVLLLVAATAVPALWTMTCYSSDRVISMWGQAEGCMPSTPAPEHPAIKLLCCDFTSVQSEIGAFEHHGNVHLAAVAHPVARLAIATVAQALQACLTRAFEHGPPPRGARHDLLAIGRLRI